MKYSQKKSKTAYFHVLEFILKIYAILLALEIQPKRVKTPYFHVLESILKIYAVVLALEIQPKRVKNSIFPCTREYLENLRTHFCGF